MNVLSGLGLVLPTSALPADVRAGSKSAQEDYKAALGFEQLLVKQLVGTMAKDGPLADGPYAQTMQDSFSDALEAGGGLGLARTMYEQIRGRA
jgi:hypothetical protein